MEQLLHPPPGSNATPISSTNLVRYETYHYPPHHFGVKTLAIRSLHNVRGYPVGESIIVGGCCGDCVGDDFGESGESRGGGCGRRC